MRFIDLERLREITDWPPGWQPYPNMTIDKWRERLQAVRDNLQNATTAQERGKIIDDNGDLWSEVKFHLRRYSCDKCWYCETKVIGYPGDIDHYRPKKRVTEAPEHEGYWWLAFDWRNWRFVCRFCNSANKDQETGHVSGKANHFPLVDDDETRRVKSRIDCDYEDLWRYERPALLDPTVREDIGLLTFTSEGVPIPVETDKQLIKYKRADKTIEVYHLDRSSLNNARKKVYVLAERLVRAYLKHQSKWEKEQSDEDREKAKEASHALAHMIARDAEYSETAITYLREYYLHHPQETWIIILLSTPSEPVYANIHVPGSNNTSKTTDGSKASS